jgi:signal transduction histidine kinase
MDRQARILVVDDEPRSLELLVRTLRRLGRVESFTSGEEAWSSAQAEPLDLVISDQRMPGMKGVDLLARVAEHDACAGRVLLTGYADIGATIEAINAGRVHAYITKPWQPDQLLLTAKGLVERVRLERDNQALLATLLQRNEALEEALGCAEDAQRRAVSAERLAAIGRMVATIAHDFRGPLSVIQAATSELAREPLPAEEVRALAAGALEECERMARMCAELLDETRASENRESRTTEELDPWVADVVAVAAEEAARQGVVLETRLEGSLRVSIDGDRLRRALLNLVYNGIEAMPEGGVLRVETGRDAGAALIRVVDSGAGIPEAIQERLFEPFATFGKANGTGLGLAVVKKVVDDHGGSIAVEKAPGGGTAFALRLPGAAAPGSA